MRKRLSIILIALAGCSTADDKDVELPTLGVTEHSLKVNQMELKNAYHAINSYQYAGKNFDIVKNHVEDFSVLTEDYFPLAYGPIKLGLITPKEFNNPTTYSYTKVKRERLIEPVESIHAIIESDVKFQQPAFQCLSDYRRCMKHSDAAVSCGAVYFICLAERVIPNAGSN